MKTRIFKLILTGVLAASLFTGCGRSKYSEASYSGAVMNDSAVAKSASYDYEMMADEAVEYDDDYESYEEAPASGGAIVSDTGESPNISVNSSRKLIRTVDLSVEALDYEKLMADIKQRVNALGGYFESMDESGNVQQGRARYSNMTIRIPKDKADELIQVVEAESNITNRSENVTDVTLDYSDKESHKKVLLAEQDRLLAMMEQAETIDEMITIESRLSEVRYQIESMESQLRTYDNKIDYTTVYLRVSEVEKITPVEEPGFFRRIQEGFAESCEGALEFLQDLAAWFIINIPYLLILAVFVLIFIFLILKPMLKKAKINGEKKRREREEFQLRRIAAQSGNYVPAPGQNPAPAPTAKNMPAPTAGQSAPEAPESTEKAPETKGNK